MSEPPIFSVTCSKCGEVHRNTDPAIDHPIDYVHALRAEGWDIPAHSAKILCKKCAS